MSYAFCYVYYIYIDPLDPPQLEKVDPQTPQILKVGGTCPPWAHGGTAPALGPLFSNWE